MTAANIKGRGTNKLIHPDRPCVACAKCGINYTSRWHHKVNKPRDYLDWLKSTFNLSLDDCICNACNIYIEKLTTGPSPPKKQRPNLCRVCNVSADHEAEINNVTIFLEVMGVDIAEVSSQCSVYLCQQHYIKWRDNRLRFFVPFECSMPDCSVKVKSERESRNVPCYDILKKYFEETNEDRYLSLTEESQICKKCNTTLSRLTKTLDEKYKASSIEMKPNLQSLISQYERTLHTNNEIHDTNFKVVALTETYLYLAKTLLLELPVLYCEVLQYFRNNVCTISLENPNIQGTIVSSCKAKGYLWLRLKLETEFFGNASFHPYKKGGCVHRPKGILILKYNVDLISMVHDMYLERKKSNEDKYTTFNIPSPEVDENPLIIAYTTVLHDLSRRYQNQIQTFKAMFDDKDLCHLKFTDIAASIDPFIWNFHYLASQSKNEWKTFKSIPSLDALYLPSGIEDSCHSRNRVLRTIFSVCHTLYQVSKGECAHPLHVLLADTIDTYSGSAKLSNIFNSFGILSSKRRAKECIKTIVDEKVATQFMEDIDRNSFTIVSIDNIDIGQPYASVKLNGDQRGIHATSFQALQPKPTALSGIECQEMSDNMHLSLNHFTVNTDEVAVINEMQQNMFDFVLKKNAIENTDICMPDFKSYISQFEIHETEKANVVYLGVLNEPCDNKEAVKHVLENIHEIFEVDKTKQNLVIVGDAKTFDIFCKLKHEYTEELSWVIPFPGDWHILKNTQPVLIKIYFDAGLKEIAKLTHKEDGLLTVLQQCSNFKKSHNFLLNMWECFYRAQLLKFFEFRNSKSDLNDFYCKVTSSEILQDTKQFVLTTQSKPQKNTSVEMKALKGDLKTKLQLDSLKKDFEGFCQTVCEKDDTFNFWHNFVHRDCFNYVSLYLAFRSSNWNLRVASLKNLSPLFHAFDRHMYLRLIPYHLNDVFTFPPTLLQCMESGGFSATITGKAWHQLALDEAHESLINRDVKESVRKPSPELLDTMAVYLPYRASVQANVSEQLHINKKNELQTEKGFSKTKQADEKSICSVYLQKIKEGHVFKYDHFENRGLVRLFTNEKADGSVHFDLMNFYNIGKKCMDAYISSRILKTPSTPAPVRKKVLRTFTETKPKVTIKKTSGAKEKSMYNRCIKKEMANSMHTGKPLNKFHQYIPLPRAICMSDASMHHQDTKSNATRTLNGRYKNVLSDKLPPNFHPNLVVLEGMFIINSAPIRSHHKTFSDLISYLVRRWIIPHLKANATEVQVLFDRPGALTNGKPSLKDIERLRRDRDTDKNSSQAIDMITASTKLPKGKWIDFLKNRGNKYKYIALLSQELLQNVKPHLKDFQMCVLEGCFSSGKSFGIKSKQDIFEIEQHASNHEETDTLIWATVKASDHKDILIFSPDTDVYFIGFSHVSSVIQSRNIFIQQNMLGDNIKYLHFNQLVDCLLRDPDLVNIPPEKICKSMQVLYICSGCDYTSFFVGFGKAYFFNTLFQYSGFISGSLLDIPGDLSLTSPDNLHSGFLSFVRLIGCLYFKKHATEFIPDFNNACDLFKHVLNTNLTLSQRNVHESWLSLIRDKVQVRVSYEDETPPSLTALEYHWKRSCVVSQIYDMSENQIINIPNLTDYGFRIQDDRIQPIWDDETHIKRIQHHVDWLLRGCKCKKGCVKNNCKCKKNNNKCGPGCSCLNCKNYDVPENVNNDLIGVEIEIEESTTIASDSDEEEDFRNTS